ncbi:hypothetical protein CC2G_010983 [Coprinopsis cinerea AmutBmut pab1-1]|nr:hypothetical protein CC2G_010983 [Coprinopsis cinerea AmutBmut pab1-1]
MAVNPRSVREFRASANTLLRITNSRQAVRGKRGSRFRSECFDWSLRKAREPQRYSNILSLRSPLLDRPQK